MNIGKCDTLLASASSAMPNQRIDHWREADWYQKSLEIYQDLKSKGTLGGADAKKRDEVPSEIEKCDEALKNLGLFQHIKPKL